MRQVNLAECSGLITEATVSGSSGRGV